MPEIMAPSFPVCGGPLHSDAEKCTFCGSYIVIKTDLPTLDRQLLNQSVIQEHISDFRRRVRVGNFDEEAHYGQGMAYYSVGLLDDAIEELTQAARLMPENPHIQAKLAIALYHSYNAGNSAAEAQMTSRIQRALLVDPNHPEATILQAEAIIDQGHYADVVQKLQTLNGQVQDRVRQNLVDALGTDCDQRLNSKNWAGARRREPLDGKAARDLTIKMLQRRRELVLKTIYVRATAINQTKTSSSGSIDGKRIGFTLLWTLGAAGVGLILFLLLMTNASAMSDEETLSETPATLSVVAGLLFLGSLLIG
jgi:tetratricopeptide (TPR) repeat protein